jgi:hypothetical protein
VKYSTLEEKINTKNIRTKRVTLTQFTILTLQQLPGSRAPWNQSWGRGINAEPGPPYLKEKSQLEPSRDGGDMRRDRE